MPVPKWVHEAIFYQIFPDRFANGNVGNDPANVQNWGSAPDRWGYQGGDIQGIIEHLDYLEDLGVNAIYLNPIFQSTANHRYHIIDYKEIDPILGTVEDFKKLLKIAHSKGFKVILDGVFNHCGRGFFAFADVLENEEKSPYVDWFHIRKFPLNAFSKGKAQNYIGWWEIKDLPKLNTDNPATRKYLFDAIRFWTEMGIDGWRLDVPNEIDDDEFWAEFRTLVRSINPEAYIVGEIWDVNSRWVNDSHFDGLMNYPLRDAILDVLRGKLEFSALSNVQPEIEAAYPAEHHLMQYNLLSSHDTRRSLSILDGDLQKLKLAYAALFAFPGAPAIYYGDEIGMVGNREPESRGAFPWDEKEWNHEQRDWIKRLIAVRKQNRALREGIFAPMNLMVGKNIFAFSRLIEGDEVIFVANFSESKETIDLEKDMHVEMHATQYCDLLDGDTKIKQKLELAPYQARYIKKI